MKLVLLGPPGAGKGTLANVLKETLGIAHISTGDILREEIGRNTPLGNEAGKFIERGKLVPDNVVTRLIEQKLTTDKSLSNGYMLDGFPRTETQARELDRILKELGKPLDYAIYLESTMSVIIKRLAGRRVCRSCGALFHMKNKPPRQDGVCDECGGEVYQRADDNEETVRTRIKVYENNTKPIVDYYAAQGKLCKVDADKDAPELQEILLNIFNENQ